MGVVTTLPRGRELTRTELEALPDDGWRHELVDGALLVTPAPSLRHQRAALRLAMLLVERCPAHLEVVVAPFDVVLADNTVLQPDLLVALRADLTDKDLPAPPLLVVEVLSPSTRTIDLHLKRHRYEAAGCLSYCVLDPDALSVTAWELHDGSYDEVGHAVDDEELALDLPYPVVLRPADLTRQE
ncbi:MAG: Uma2 family endonuclease [Nocardioides sp.]